MDTNKVNGIRRNEVEQFIAPCSETPSLPLKNPEGVSLGMMKQQVKRNSQDHEAMVRVQREKIQIGWKNDKRFEGKSGVRVLR